VVCFTHILSLAIVYWGFHVKNPDQRLKNGHPLLIDDHMEMHALID